MHADILALLRARSDDGWAQTPESWMALRLVRPMSEIQEAVQTDLRGQVAVHYMGTCRDFDCSEPFELGPDVDVDTAWDCPLCGVRNLAADGLIGLEYSLTSEA